MCLIDSATTHTILKSNKFFSCLVMREVNVSIIYSTTNIFEYIIYNVWIVNFTLVWKYEKSIALFIVLQIYLKTLEELLYFYQEV